MDFEKSTLYTEEKYTKIIRVKEERLQESKILSNHFLKKILENKFISQQHKWRVAVRKDCVKAALKKVILIKCYRISIKENMLDEIMNWKKLWRKKKVYIRK